ncbi:hypothetical protein J6590_003501 [Homalodisca vitripennis]|nr:hypothetical protein J6590_003501 [Homalodisca vitripennis]
MKYPYHVSNTSVIIKYPRSDPATRMTGPCRISFPGPAKAEYGPASLVTFLLLYWSSTVRITSDFYNILPWSVKWSGTEREQIHSPLCCASICTVLYVAGQDLIRAFAESVIVLVSCLTK